MLDQFQMYRFDGLLGDITLPAHGFNHFFLKAHAFKFIPTEQHAFQNRALTLELKRPLDEIFPDTADISDLFKLKMRSSLTRPVWQVGGRLTCI